MVMPAPRKNSGPYCSSRKPTQPKKVVGIETLLSKVARPAQKAAGKAPPRLACAGCGAGVVRCYSALGWSASTSSMICKRSSSEMAASASLICAVSSLPLATPMAMEVSAGSVSKPCPSANST